MSEAFLAQADHNNRQRKQTQQQTATAASKEKQPVKKAVTVFVSSSATGSVHPVEVKAAPFGNLLPRGEQGLVVRQTARHRQAVNNKEDSV